MLNHGLGPTNTRGYFAHLDAKTNSRVKLPGWEMAGKGGKDLDSLHALLCSDDILNPCQIKYRRTVELICFTFFVDNRFAPNWYDWWWAVPGALASKVLASILHLIIHWRISLIMRAKWRLSLSLSSCSERVTSTDLANALSADKRTRFLPLSNWCVRKLG